MKALKLLVVQNYNVKNESNKELNRQLICYDKKVHIRFREYDKEEYITGIENKLTFIYTLIAEIPDLQLNTIKSLSPKELEELEKGNMDILFKAHLKNIEATIYESSIKQELNRYFGMDTLSVKKSKIYKPSKVKNNTLSYFNLLFGKTNILLNDIQKLNLLPLIELCFRDTIEFKLEPYDEIENRETKIRTKLINKQTRKINLKDKNKIRYSSLW